MASTVEEQQEAALAALEEEASGIGDRGASGGEGADGSAEAPTSPLPHASVEAEDDAPAARVSSGAAASNGHLTLKDPDLQIEMEDALRSAALLPEEIKRRYLKQDKKLAEKRQDAIALRASQLALSLTGLDSEGEEGEDEKDDSSPTRVPPVPARRIGDDDGAPEVLDADTEHTQRLDAQADAKEEKEKREGLERELEKARGGKIKKGFRAVKNIPAAVKAAKQPS